MHRKDHFTSSQYMSVPEAARYLGIGRKMVYQLLDNGALTFTRERGAIRIVAESVTAFHQSDQLS